MGITTFAQAPAREFEIGHIKGRWTELGRAAGCVRIGLRRIQIPAGGWSTPAHEHGAEEEIFYVLSGRGISWQKGSGAEVGAGDCILYLPGRGAHTVHAREDVDLLAFGPRINEESMRFPRLGLSLIGNRMVESLAASVDGAPLQFVREAEIGPPDLVAPPAPAAPRPPTIVNVGTLEGEPWGRGRVSAHRRDLGEATGSRDTGLKHVEVEPSMWATPPHCHSHEEELFVILDGDGVVVLGDDELPVTPGSVVARPPATRVAHAFRAGAAGLTYLAYGTREPGDMCYYPRSNKVSFRGLGVIARIEQLEYWDGEA